MDKYLITTDQLRALLQDRIEWSIANPDFSQTTSKHLLYLKETLGISVDYVNIKQKYIDFAFSQTLCILPSIGISRGPNEDSYYISIDSYDKFMYEIRYRAIFKQILDRPDIQFVITKDDKIIIIKTELKVP